MSKRTIYVVDDELHILELIKYNLDTAGYSTETFETGEELYNAINNKLPDLIILDIMLADESGLDICKKLKSMEHTERIPVIFLTAKGEEFDKVLGLELGADDYITKPFSVRELSARVKALLRRTEINSTVDSKHKNKIKVRDIEMDKERREVKKNGELLQLTYKEFELLKLLMENKGKVLAREVLLSNVWGFDYVGESRTIDVHIRNLRKHLNDNEETYIETVRGVGYRFRD